MSQMTVFGAESEARWRWGGLFTQGFARYAPGQRNPFEVGTRRFGSIKIHGRGPSWEAAFSNACIETAASRAAKPVLRASSPIKGMTKPAFGLEPKS